MSGRPSIASTSDASVSCRRRGADQVAVAQHRDRVRELEHLAEEVGDQDDRRPAGDERADDLVQLLASRRRSSAAVGSSMTISCASRESARRISTFCCSPVRRRPAGASPGSSKPAPRGELVVGRVELPAAQNAGARRLDAEEDVLRDRQLRDDERLLRDRRDPVLERLARRAERDRLAVEDDPAAVRARARPRRSARAWTCRRRSRRRARGRSRGRPSSETPRSAWTPPKCLATSRHCEIRTTPSSVPGGATPATQP